MIFPISEAYPAEVMMADLALHVVTACVLFDGATTLLVRTLFGVDQDPVDILAFRRVLFLPFFDHNTGCWAVSLVAAFVAEVVAAKAFHSVGHAICDFVHCVLALGVGTPLHLLVVFCER